MKNKFQAIAFIVFSIALVACGARSAGDETMEKLVEKRDSLRKEKNELVEELEKIEADIAARDTTEDLTEVTIVQVAPESFNHYFTVQASLEATRNAQLYPETQARVIDIRVNEGDRVKAGQTILELDTDIIEKNIAEVQTNLSLAKDVYERQKRLWDKNIGSEMQYLEAKNRKEQLESKLATLREQKNMATVKAPFEGVVDKIVPRIGEMVSPAMAVARIINLDDVYLIADVSERYLGRVKTGDSVKVVFPQVDTVKSTITRIGNFINPANRSFELTIRVPNEEEKLKPNMIAEVEINDYHVDSAITIPSSIVQEDTRGRKYLYLVTNNGEKSTVEKRFVKTGRNYKGKMIISEGLKAGDEVVDKGSRKIVEGQGVKVLKDREALVQN